MGKWWMGLTLVVLLVFTARNHFAFQTPYYSSDAAYLEVRSIESLQQGKLLWNDPLGYGGRTLVRSPVFDAILAFFTLFMPFTTALKTIPNIFASLLIIPAFLISRKLTNNTPISLFSALLAGLVPAYFSHTFNHISPNTLAMTLFFFTVYAWLKTPTRQWIYIFLTALLVFVFLSPLSIILVLSIGLYLALAALEQIKPRAAEYELGLFSIFFALWAQFLLYKKLILFHGPAVIWQNIPKELLSSFFTNVTMLGAIAQIGIFPLVDGTRALYKTAFKEPSKESLMLLSITIVSALTLWLKLINITTGFMLLGITLAILFSKSLLLTLNYFNETKIRRYSVLILVSIMISAFITTAYPAYTQTKSQLQSTITPEEVNALTKLQNTTAEDAVIIAPPSYGNYITALAKRKNVIDTYFFLRPRTSERYQDVSRIYKTPFETEAVELVDKYDATYVIVTPNSKDLTYGESPCFQRIHATNIIIYQKDAACEVKVVA